MCFSFIRYLSFLTVEYETGAGAGAGGRPGGHPPAWTPGAGNCSTARTPGGCSAGRRDDGRVGPGQALPPINHLVDLDVHLGAGLRHPVTGRIEARDVSRTLRGRGTRPQDAEVLADLNALADRFGAADDGVLAGVARAGQLEGDHSRRVGDDQALRRQVRELRPERWSVHLVLAELCEGAVDLGEQLEAAEGAALAEAGVALDCGGCLHPLDPLGFCGRPPPGRHATEIVAHVHLRRRARIFGDGEGPADLAELASLRDVQATFT